MKTKTKVTFSIAFIVLLALVIVGYKSCNLYDKYSVLKGEYDALAEEYDQQKVESFTKISDLRTIISHNEDKIRTIVSHIRVKDEEIAELHGTTDELEGAYEELIDKDAKISNLTEQVVAWKQKFTLAESVIADKDAIIFSLNEKYESQVKISLEWKGMYENEATLRVIADERFKLTDRKLRGIQLNLNINQGITYGVVGGVGVFLLTDDPVLSLVVGAGTAIAKWIIF